MRNEKGSGPIEWMLVMLLLLVLSLSIFMLASTTSMQYESLEQQKSMDTELRVATSYLTTKLRQSDEVGKIHVIEHDGYNQVMLMIEEVFFGESYETWIYVTDGKLREATIVANGRLDDALSFEIAEVKDVVFKWLPQKGIDMTIIGHDDQVRDVFISLKTADN